MKSYFAGTLSIVIAFADTVLTLCRTGDAATTGTTSWITIVTPGASLASEAVVTDSTGTLTLMIAMWSRGAQCASTGPATDIRHQVPCTGSTAIAMLAVGQTGTHTAAGIRVTYVTRSHAWIAYCESIIKDLYISAVSSCCCPVILCG